MFVEVLDFTDSYNDLIRYGQNLSKTKNIVLNSEFVESYVKTKDGYYEVTFGSGKILYVQRLDGKDLFDDSL